MKGRLDRVFKSLARTFLFVPSVVVVELDMVYKVAVWIRIHLPYRGFRKHVRNPPFFS